MSLFDKIKKTIEFSGPIGIAEFMQFCLYDKDYGYYTTQKPIGKLGDFTTAPEISQIFGETLGIWVISAYYNLGMPEKFRILELGAGRGTLLKDLLRVLKSHKIDKKAQIEILEINPNLQELQKQALKDYEIIFHSEIAKIKPDIIPIIIIANEFFDCLPIRQFIKTESGWRERLIGCDDKKLYYGLGPQILSPSNYLNQNDKIGTISEITLGLENHIHHIANLLKSSSGHCLIIDYGHFGDETGDSFQAIKNHNKIDPLTHLGKADLTAHVNFGAIENYAVENGLLINGPNTQSELLLALGFNERANSLIKNNPNQEKELQDQFSRLIDESAMGDLFKAIILYYEKP